MATINDFVICILLWSLQYCGLTSSREYKISGDGWTEFVYKEEPFIPFRRLNGNGWIVGMSCNKVTKLIVSP